MIHVLWLLHTSCCSLAITLFIISLKIFSRENWLTYFTNGFKNSLLDVDLQLLKLREVSRGPAGCLMMVVCGLRARLRQVHVNWPRHQEGFLFYAKHSSFCVAFMIYFQSFFKSLKWVVFSPFYQWRKEILGTFINLLQPMDFPGGTLLKNPPANAGDTGSVPGLGRSPGEGNGNPF